MDIEEAARALPAAPGGRPRAAAAIAVSGWALAVLSIAVLLTARPPVDADWWFFVVDVTVAAVYGTVAGLTLARRDHPVPYVLAVTSIGAGLAALGFAWGSLAERYDGLPAVEAVARLNSIAWVPGTLALFVVVPWLVRPGRPDRIGAAGALLGAALVIGQTVLRIADSGATEPTFLLDVSWWVYRACVVVGLLAAADALRRRLTGPSIERPGLGWLALGTAVMAVSFVPLVLPPEWLSLPIWFTPVLHLVAQTLFPAAILVAVLRQRMWGIDLAVSRATVAGSLTVLLVALYALVATALNRIVPVGSGDLFAAAAVAVAVQPSRLWLQRRVQALVYGEGAEPGRAVRRLGGYLGRAESMDELLGGLVESVGVALRLESVVLRVDGVRASAWGAPTSEPLQLPLHRTGRTLGTLEVTAPPGEALDARALRSLDELAGVVTAGVVLARASQELDDARARLTSVRLEERRIIRRELHDGLGPSLAGLRLGLEGARNLAERDPAAAAELLGALGDELDQRVDEVRALSRSLLPPVLDELGLGPALDELAARRRGTGLQLVVRHANTELLAPHQAAAAYGIAIEAVTNVARHAEASRCIVDVAVAEDLVVLIDDDGGGIAPGAVPGVGTRSMRERAEEQGGTLRIAALEPRGTRVEARIPL